MCSGDPRLGWSASLACTRTVADHGRSDRPNAATYRSKFLGTAKRKGGKEERRKGAAATNLVNGARAQPERSGKAERRLRWAGLLEKQPSSALRAYFSSEGVGSLCQDRSSES